MSASDGLASPRRTSGPLTAITAIAVIPAGALLLGLLGGCAVVSIAGATAGAAIQVAGAVVATGVTVTGKVVGKTIDLVVPGGPPTP